MSTIVNATETTLADVKSAAQAVYTAADLDTLRAAFTEYDLVVSRYTAENFASDSGLEIDLDRVPQFCTAAAPSESEISLSRAWYSRDDQRILVKDGSEEYAWYFVTYDDERI